MRNKTRIPLPIICCGVLILVAGELAAGTGIYFVAMMAVGVLSAFLTYNLLGGLKTISGIGFTGFALSALVVSQVAKVCLFEPADKNLRVPDLTITVYAVYFFCLMLGTFTFGRLRLQLPRPAEPTTDAQFQFLYYLSVVGGFAGSLAVTIMDIAGGDAKSSMAHGVARALAFLLPFSLVIAVDERIRNSHGRHVLGWKALMPAVAMQFLGFVGASRQGFVEPILIIFLTGYLRGYRFRRRHFITAMAGMAVFLLYVSPFYLYTRGIIRGAPTFKAQFASAVDELESAPSHWDALKHEATEVLIGGDNLDNYFTQPGLGFLNRFSLISSDSTLIDACSQGFHYGFTSLELDFRSQLPRFIDRNKPDVGSESYLGHLDGMEGDAFETTNSTITPVADSFGAFGLLGVSLYAFLGMPLIFIVFESVFDMSRPWGTVAAVGLMFGIVALSMGAQIMSTMIRTPIYIVALSWALRWVAGMTPMRGDAPGRLPSGQMEWQSIPLSERQP